MNAFEPAPVVPDHELVRELGRGSFGSVWLARSRTGVHHAIKIVPKRRLEALAHELAGLRAYEVAAGRHPSLIEVRHVGETDDALYCVMELADGYSTAPTFSAADYEPRTLQSDLERRGALTLAEAAPVVRAVLDGLEHLHGQGLLHRDVKPGNVVFVGGRAKLADVGLVASRARRADHAGSPDWMPPESVVDASGDLYSLGIVLYCAVTGAPASRFPELTEAIAPERLAAFRRIAPVLDRACAPHGDDRFRDAREFRHAFDVALGEAVEPARRVRRRVLVVAAGVVALVAAGFAAWSATRGDEVQAQRPALAGRLEIQYRDPEDPTFLSTVSEASPNVPLLITGAVSVRAELSEAAYPVIAYVDDSGATKVLFPATDEEAAEKRSSVATGKFELEEPAGTLTFVLLVSREPVDDYDDLARQVARAGAAPKCPPDSLLCVGEDGVPRTIAARRDVTRGMSPGIGRMIDAQPFPAPVHGSLDRLQAEFGRRFDLLRALAVPLVALEAAAKK